MTRWTLSLAVVAALAFVGLSIVLRVQVWGNGGMGTARVGQGQEHGIPEDRPLPLVHLIDARGRPTTLRSFRGRWVVLAPSMTLCHEVCPLTTAGLMRLERLMRAAGLGRRFVTVEVTVDPWRDSPRRLRAYRHMTGADFPLLTGDVAAVRRLWRFLGVNFERVPEGNPPDRDWMTGKPERFDVEHTDGVFLLGPGGNERLAVSGMPAVGGRIEAPLAKLLDQEGRKNLRHPTPGWSAVGLARRVQEMMGVAVAPGRATASSVGGGLSRGGSLREGLETRRGRSAVVNVWASWCPPCREELPLFSAAERRFGHRIGFLGADLEDDAESARALLARVGTDYPSYPVDAAEVGELLGPVQGTPLTFYLDKSGEVVGEHIGAYRSAAELDADLLRQPAP